MNNVIRSDLTGIDGMGSAFMPGAHGVPTQDIGVIPQFYMDTEVDGMETRKQGKPVYKNVEMVHVIFAGSNGQTIRRKVLAEDMQRWPQHYKAFKEGNADDEFIQGTPVTQAPFLSRAQAQTLRARNISSVEQLANLNDGQIMDLGMGGRQLVNDARRFLKAQSGTADTVSMMRKLEELEREVSRLNTQNSTLEGQLNASERAVELAAAVAGRNVTPEQIQANFTPSPEDEPTDPAMDAMLLEMNGLKPTGPQVAAKQAAQPEPKPRARNKPHKGPGLGKVKDLPVNDTPLEAE